MGNTSSTRQPLAIQRSSSPKSIKKQAQVLDLNHPDKLKKKLKTLIKKNSHAITKSHIQLPNPIRQKSDWLLINFPSRPQKRTPKVTHFLRNQKSISSLHFVFETLSSWKIFQLKGLHYITSLSLDLSSVKSCSPEHFKCLSLTLRNFKKLASLLIIFPSSVEITPKHIIYLGLAIHPLRALVHLSLKFSPQKRLNFSTLKPFAKFLRKLTWLKSLSLGQFAPMTPMALNSLPPVLKKLISLESLDLGLANMGNFQSKSIHQIFLMLKDHHKTSLKNLALDFKNCSVDFPNFDPIPQGLAMLDLSQLQSFQLNCPRNQASKGLQQLIATLQKSRLKKLNLDLSESSLTELSLNLKGLKHLSSLSLNPGSLVTGIKDVGTIIQPLKNLEYLDIDFSGQPTSFVSPWRYLMIGMIHFSAQLKGLKNLTHFSLNLRNLAKITNEGLEAFSICLQYLTKLSSLNLVLAGLKISNSRRISTLCLALGKLTKLTELSLDFSENEEFDLRDLDSLAGTITTNLSSLRSINLRFHGCISLAQNGESFSELFNSLSQFELLKEIALEFPFFLENANYTSHKNYFRLIED